ncbi:hypothetical protein ACPEEZ_06940 [Frigoribacterium sp. 2-23]|uniref:hypothetical protein n=1 Tax=Frigoribacterium sp. 2-23 TaxID=3415006 RepID=UPI003C6F7CB9
MGSHSRAEAACRSRSIVQVKCYIEEYENTEGRPSARLREKASGRKVDIGLADVEDRQAFLRFLGGAARNRAVMPGVFLKESEEDCVLVNGELDFDAPDELRFLNNSRLSYIFA